MVSERLLQSRLRYIIFPALIAFYTGAGFFMAREKYLPAVFFFFTGLLAVWMVIYMFNSTNKALTGFLDALRNNDTALQFPQAHHIKSLKNLYESLNNLNRHFQSIKLQYEYNEKYYKALIRHSATGLLVLNADNEIELINKVACQYAGISPDSTNPNLLKIRNPLFYEAICNLRPGEDTTYKHVWGNNLQLLSFRATLLSKEENTVKLISIQDIRHELEYKELESYRKLISVLTHEIMNLTSPLTSVSKALYTMYHKNERTIEINEVDDQVLKTTLNSLQVIDEQTNGILNFIDNYRKISRIPQPVMQFFPVEEWIEQLKIVYADRMKENRIAFAIHTDRSMKQILADKKLLNQVIINLVNNAVDAVMENEGKRKISIDLSTLPPNRVSISVRNNGPIIQPDVQEKIFVPFFTTKRDGSGIGLSICREIMKLHKGSLTVVSSGDGSTTFTMEF